MISIISLNHSQWNSFYNKNFAFSFYFLLIIICVRVWWPEFFFNPTWKARGATYVMKLKLWLYFYCSRSQLFSYTNFWYSGSSSPLSMIFFYLGFFHLNLCVFLFCFSYCLLSIIIWNFKLRWSLFNEKR